MVLAFTNLVSVLAKNIVSSSLVKETCFEIFCRIDAINFRKRKVSIKSNNKSIVYEDSKNEKLNELVDATFNYFNTSGLESPDTKVMIYTCQISSLLRQNKLVEAKKIIDVIEPIVKGIDGKKSNIEFDVIIADYKIRNKEKIDSEKLLKEVIPYLIENENYQRLQIF